MSFKKVNNLFQYHLFNETNIIINNNTIELIDRVFDRWNEIIVYNPSGRVIDINLYFKRLDLPNVLAIRPLYVLVDILVMFSMVKEKLF